MKITGQQYQRLMKAYQKSGSVSAAAMKAGMDRKTASKYIKGGEVPGGSSGPRGWRTRNDPLEKIWPEAQRWLESCPEVEAKQLFEHLIEGGAAKVESSALRTFQRRVHEWRRRNGPDREVFFAQKPMPGECLQFDWTHGDELGVTVGGIAYGHLLGHAVLPYSNWEWAVPCRSESFLSLKTGVQDAFWVLGGITPVLQTDQSSTATHQVARNGTKRGYNQEYLHFCEHLGTTPRTTKVKSPNQNGDVESANRHLKRRLRQHLILRQSRDFLSAQAYAAWVAHVCMKANDRRASRLAEELPHFRVLPGTRYPDAEEHSARVSSNCTARIRGCPYSVPARLIGAVVQGQVSESEVVIMHNGQEVVRYDRQPGKRPRIRYQDVIGSLLRKPGAFERYVYRDELFPRSVYRQTYDKIVAGGGAASSLRYLQILDVAVRMGEDRVADVLGRDLREGLVPDATKVEETLRTPDTPAEQMRAYEPEFGAYDQLLGEVAS